MSASIDSQSIAIGDWIRYSVEIKHPSVLQVTIPSYRDTLGSFDIVQQDSIVKTESNGIVQWEKKFVITKFDAGSHYIPPFAVQYKDDAGKIRTAQSNSIPVEVRGIEVDTSQAIRDVKPQLSLPITAEEIAMYAAIALALAAAGYGIYYYVKRRAKKVNAVEEEKPNIPAHVLALMQLDELQAKGLWQKGETKIFYSEATEIIRRYFEHRYGILALEMTTGEVMDQLKRYEISKNIFSEIESFLSDADLVKFAKYQPIALENESVIPAARTIVESTKPVESVAQEAEKTEEVTTHA
ncbi:MAG: hypothetical protein HYV29_15115 [Ignavibacteriales bacterium]|nr:hypothetical protein [Ignavibacteriales bacterium]